MREKLTDFLERETAFRDPDEFDHWISNLDTSEVIDRADEWMKISVDGLQEWLRKKYKTGYVDVEEVIEFINRK